MTQCLAPATIQAEDKWLIMTCYILWYILCYITCKSHLDTTVDSFLDRNPPTAPPWGIGIKHLICYTILRICYITTYIVHLVYSMIYSMYTCFRVTQRYAILYSTVHVKTAILVNAFITPVSWHIIYNTHFYYIPCYIVVRGVILHVISQFYPFLDTVYSYLFVNSMFYRVTIWQRWNIPCNTTGYFEKLYYV